MSNALPLTWEIREQYYLLQTGRPRLTARQARQAGRMRYREHLQRIGELGPSGASGLPVRRPHRGDR